MFELSADDRTLRYSLADGTAMIAPRESDQVGFAQVRISSDRAVIGWVATEQTCCASYAVPLRLIVAGQGGVVAKFSGSQGIFGWCFGAEPGTVVYRQEPLHGPTIETFTLGRVTDGAAVATHVRDSTVGASGSASAALPAWAMCAAPR